MNLFHTHTFSLIFKLDIFFVCFFYVFLKLFVFCYFVFCCMYFYLVFHTSIINSELQFEFIMQIPDSLSDLNSIALHSEKAMPLTCMHAPLHKGNKINVRLDYHFGNDYVCVTCYH